MALGHFRLVFFSLHGTEGDHISHTEIWSGFSCFVLSGYKMLHYWMKLISETYRILLMWHI